VIYLRKPYKLLIALISIFVFGCANKPCLKLDNSDFKEALNFYYIYLDSAKFDKGRDYIVIKAKTTNDSIFISMFNWAGAYVFLNNQDQIANFMRYKNHDLLFIGDFPNKIVTIDKLSKSDVIKLINSKFPNEYSKFCKDPYSIGPLIYDYKTLEIVFKGDYFVKRKYQH
jgi:hypothetical protein